MEKREGIVAAGNWIVDRVKKIDVWPERGMLANILEESVGTGGAPYNVLIDLAKLKAGIPLYAAGIVGNDASGKFILKDLKANCIDITAMRMTDMLPTSYTDVMTEMRSGARTFFHCRGANALLDIGHLNAIDRNARIFHLGYLLLLDRLDAPDARFGARWGRLLAQLSRQGYKTSVNGVVSAKIKILKELVAGDVVLPRSSLPLTIADTTSLPATKTSPHLSQEFGDMDPVRLLQLFSRGNSVMRMLVHP